MRVTLYLTLLVMLLTAGSSLALDFEIAEVIEVGPIYQGSMLRPAQWSPDGQWIAYFDGKELMLADTLGVSHPVAEVELVPVRFRWVGSEEIVVSQKLIISNGESQRRLTKIDIVTGSQTTLEEYTRRGKRNDNTAERQFWSLWETIEGNAYYMVSEEGRQRRNMVPLKNGTMPPARENHVLRTGEDALYVVRVDNADSTRISNKPYSGYGGLPISMNSDRSVIMFGGNIVRLTDDNLIILDTLSEIKAYPGCSLGGGFLSHSMNPSYSEVCFVLICADSDENESIRAGVYDYTTYQFTILDDKIGLSMCDRPEFSPDGKDLTVLSQGQLYIIKRTILGLEEVNCESHFIS